MKPPALGLFVGGFWITDLISLLSQKLTGSFFFYIFYFFVEILILFIHWFHKLVEYLVMVISNSFSDNIHTYTYVYLRLISGNLYCTFDMAISSFFLHMPYNFVLVPMYLKK